MIFLSMQNKFHCCYGSIFCIPFCLVLNLALLLKYRNCTLLEISGISLQHHERLLETPLRTHTWLTEVSSAAVCCYVHNWVEEGFNLLSWGLGMFISSCRLASGERQHLAKNCFLNKVIEKEHALKWGFIIAKLLSRS